jgi:iron complex outermembrane receptor protein
MLAFGGTLAIGALPAMAQEAPTQRVEITGSAIKRIDAETAVPVTVLKTEDLKKQGITTVEQIVATLSLSQANQGTSQSVGLGTGGASFANLRALGQNKTLVLLNGRRLANNAIDGSAPDLNMIPVAALERVEVLRDSASALYGTDAIGGVINFITRKDWQAGSISVGLDSPQHAGGNSYNANVGFGFGDLDKDRFNFFGFLDFERQDPLRASQRPDVNNRSIKTSPTTSPGQYNQGGLVQNPSFPACGSPDGIPNSAGGADATCGYLYARKVDLIPVGDRVSGFLKGTFQLNEQNQLGLEYFISQNTNRTKVAGVPYGALWMNPSSKYYPGNGITPLPTAFTLDPTYLPGTAPAGATPGVIKLRWRDEASGGRQEQTDNTQQRLIASLDGAMAGWDYKTAFAYNENRLVDTLVGGYTDGTKIASGILNGILNPFGPQDAAGAAYLAGAATNGALFHAKGKVYSFDLSASREVGDWFHAGRSAGLAVGTEFRREKFYDRAFPDFASLVVSSTGFDPATDNEGSRNVAALYSELSVPLLKQLEVTASVRYDRYSDFGSTTNPKFSFRFQPMKEVLVRGSVAKGFRAPSLYDLYAPNTFTNTADNLNDPVRCPGGTPIGGASAADNCDVQFMVLAGGNKNLKPETSKSMTLGIVLEPTANFNVGVDFWSIHLRHQIASLVDTLLFGDPSKYSSFYHRAPDGSISTDGSLCPGPNCGYVDEYTLNLGDVKTSGIDLSSTYRLRAGDAGNFTLGFNGTWVHRYDYQLEEGGEWFHNVGAYGQSLPNGGGPVFRWQHTLNLNWNRGPFALGLANHYKSGYTDQVATNRVSPWMTWDLYGSLQPSKAVSLTFGIKNVADKAPPYSNQSATFQVGYDPRFADATGRVFYFRGSYNF